MTAREAERYLLGLELFGMRFGLDRMRRLMTVLGAPQERFDSVHVVGTNGKSSTVRLCAALLERHGLRTGSYTSPHLRSFRERIEIGERPIGEADFAAAVARAAHAAELVERGAAPDDRVTQFEALTAAAYSELAGRGVELAVVEAGLGGRFDATNVIPSKVTVLTSVGLEHTRWLGPTLTDIAREKLAVLRPGSTLVTGPLAPAVERVARDIAAERGSQLVRVGAAVDRGSRDPVAGGLPASDPGGSSAADPGGPSAADPGGPSARRPLRPAMRAAGAFQRRNFALAAAAAEAFLGRPLEPAAVAAAAAETRVPGRMDVVGHDPLTIHDGAHNPAGAAALAESLAEVVGRRRPLVCVMSVLDDKDAAGMLRALLPRFERAIFTRCGNPRALSPATLETLAGKLGGPPCETVADPRAALERARRLAGAGGAVLATGSIYLVADLTREAADARASAL